jgi:hypothetical protein
MSKQSCRYPTNWVPLRTRLKRSAPRLQIHSRCQRALAPPHARGTEHATRQKRALVSPRAPWHRARHPSGKGSSVTTCPEAPCTPITRKGLQYCRMPEALSPSPGRRGLRSHHVPRGSRPAPYAERLWRRHMTEAPGPLPSRAPVSPCVMRLQNRLLMREGSGAAMCPMALGPRACPCVLKMPDIRLIMASPGTRCR